MSDYRIFFDVEGPLVNPGFDFAWFYLEHHAPEWVERVRRFDAYDDLRWELERGDRGHNTGATPLVALAVAALKGADDAALTREVESQIRFTEGVDRLMAGLSGLGMDVHLVTSSYAALPLTVAERFSIPFSRVRCMGFQPGRRGDFGGATRAEEVRSRSPLREMACDTEALGGFLDAYLEFCDAYLAAGGEPAPGATPSEEDCFLALWDSCIGEVLYDLVYMEEGVMGAHNKLRYVAWASPDPARTIYVGDGIVDADPLGYAGWGIAVNCTNPQALRSAPVAVATPTMAALLPLVEAIAAGTCDPRDPQASVGKGAKAWSAIEVDGDLANVEKEMQASKSRMKEKYARGG